MTTSGGNSSNGISSSSSGGNIGNSSYGKQQMVGGGTTAAPAATAGNTNEGKGVRTKAGGRAECERGQGSAGGMDGYQGIQMSTGVV
jgi:hypothetical protein